MKYLFIALIKFYKKHISPNTPRRCKYHPSCSSYALTAIERFGAVRGSILAAWRLLRCNPWSMGGIDYVPEKFTLKVKKYDYSQDVPCVHEHNDQDNYY
ncbi:MAG: membrane protein insertion efficiency factor YidD [Ruminococcus sp.]|nr:membrane protein insertion efficiency factor YidD [Ruminococcus sp.]